MICNAFVGGVAASQHDIQSDCKFNVHLTSIGISIQWFRLFDWLYRLSWSKRTIQWVFFMPVRARSLAVFVCLCLCLTDWMTDCVYKRVCVFNDDNLKFISWLILHQQNRNFWLLFVINDDETDWTNFANYSDASSVYEFSWDFAFSRIQNDIHDSRYIFFLYFFCSLVFAYLLASPVCDKFVSVEHFVALIKFQVCQLHWRMLGEKQYVWRP